MTKVKKDNLGLYVNAGGYICRPFFGTCFKEGNEVRAHHFGGSTRAGVGFPAHAKFKKKETFEYWSTTGTGEWESKYPDRWKIEGRQYKSWGGYLRACTKWYQEHAHLGVAKKLVEHNKKFARDAGKVHKAYYAVRALVVRTTMKNGCLETVDSEYVKLGRKV
jgi:hypothetical protein